MKHINNLKFIAITLVVIFWGAGCGSSTEVTVVFPKKGLSGTNLVELTNSELDTISDYGISANVLTSFPIKVALTNLSDSLPKNELTEGNGSFWKVNLLSNVGWYISDYDFETHTQVFEVDAPVVAHALIEFYGCGTAELTVFENNKELIDKRKTFSWNGKCPN